MSRTLSVITSDKFITVSPFYDMLGENIAREWETSVACRYVTLAESQMRKFVGVANYLTWYYPFLMPDRNMYRMIRVIQ